MIGRKIYAQRETLTRSSKQVKLVRKYFQIYVHVLPEVVLSFGDLLSLYAKEVISKVVDTDLIELNKLPKDAVEEYYAKAKSYKKGFYVSKDIHEKWGKIPHSLKKKAQFLVNQMLLEKKKEAGL
jgi:hypothetical protein